MRIAYVTQPYPPMISGAALFARQLAESMAERGHQVLVVVASDQNYPYLTQHENLTILRLRSYHNPMRVGQRFLFYPRHATFRALRLFKPEIIHTHEPLQMGNLGLEYARKAHIPITLTNHQLPWFVASYMPDKFGIRGLVETVLWKYARWVLPKFTSIIAPTQTISALITEKTKVRSETIGYGLDLNLFHPSLSQEEQQRTRKSLNLSVDIPIILHVGRLDKDKCVDRVIQASAKILREAKAHLLIVGDGSQKTSLMKLCDSLGVSDHVKFTGCVSVKEGLPEIYRTSNLFVTASEIETQGIVLLEAAASGLPIAAVDATCIPEIVRHGVNGFLSESGDLRALEANMRSLLNDASRAKDLGQAGHALVESHTAQRTMDLHEKFYQSLILDSYASLAASRTGRFRRFTKKRLDL